MRFHYFPIRYQSQAGEGDGGGSSGKTYTQAEVDELVAGLKAKNSELLGSQKTLKDEVSTLDAALKRFDGIDPEAVSAILKRFTDDEESKLIAAGKIDEVLDKRTARMKEAHQKETAALQAKIERYSAHVLGDVIRAAGQEAGIHKSAVEDAIARAKGVFVVDDNGELVAREGALDSKGKPLSPKAWLADMKELAPHWFPAPQGGGSGHGGTNIAGKKRSDMSAEEKHAFIQQHGQQAYLKLPK